MPIGHSQLENTRYHDIQSLDHLKKSAQAGALSDEKALRAVANQFESMFTSLLFSAMRSANAAFDESELFDKRYVQFYQEMLDKQLSADISRRGALGIADLLVNSFSQPKGVDPSHISEDGYYPLEKEPVFSAVDTIDKQVRALPLPSKTPENTKAFDPVAPYRVQTAEPVQVATDDHGKSVFSKHVLQAQTLQANPLQALDKSHLGEVNPVRVQSFGSSQHVQSVPIPVEKHSQKMDVEPVFSSPHDFIRKILPLARQAAQKSGLDPLALVAQSALESGWGRHMIQNAEGKAAHNLFGVKAHKGWQGESARSETTEFEQGIARKTMADFRAYDSIKDSIDDFVNMITGSQRYQEAKRVAKEPERYFEELQNAGYATDPLYADKLKRVLGTVKRLLIEAVR